MKVSIIIPVYNTEKYLSRCVDSCLNQTLTDTEIILVDDCSTDSSRNVISSYAKKYPDKIRYIFQSINQRQGAARNRGMEIAKGEYFIFVDSDDWIAPDMCEDLYNKAVETKADMVGSCYYKSWDNKEEKISVDITQDLCGTMTAQKKDKYIKNYGMFWTRIYSSEFLKKCGLIFPENIFYEDAFFNFYSVLYAERIEHIDKPFYHYYQGNQSTVRNRNNPHQYERIRLAQHILDYGRNAAKLKSYENTILYKYLYMQGANLLYTCLGQFDKPDNKIMSELAAVIKRSVSGGLKNDVFRQIPKDFQFYIKINSISSSLCVYIYKHNLYEVSAIIKNKLGRK